MLRGEQLSWLRKADAIEGITIMMQLVALVSRESLCHMMFSEVSHKAVTSLAHISPLCTVYTLL